MPAIGMPSGRPGTPRRACRSRPTRREPRAAARAARRRARSSSSSSSRLCRSNSSVRDAFVTSVACTAPPVSRQMRKLSMVPNAIAPRLGARAQPGDVVEHPARSWCPRSRGRARAGALRAPRGSCPRALSSAQTVGGAAVLPDDRVVRRACRSRGPTAASVSRWLVMPMAAIGAARRRPCASAERAAATEAQISSGSCSTQPGCG